MSERTKGQIEVLTGGRHICIQTVEPVGRFKHDVYRVTHADDQDHADADHVVACWNACEGFEGELTPGLLSKLAAIVKQCAVWREEGAERGQYFSALADSTDDGTTFGELVNQAMDEMKLSR